MQRANQEVWTASCLDGKNCLTLKQIVGSFSSPISEEHAWSIVYQMVRTLDICLSNPAVHHRLCSANSLDHVLLHQDGLVHEGTFLIDVGAFNHDRVPITSENKARFQEF